LRSLRAGDIGGFDDDSRRRTTGAHDDAGAFVGDNVVFEAGVADRLLHRNVIPGGAATEKTHRTTIDDLSRIKTRSAVDLRAEAKLGLLCCARNTAAGVVQARQHFLSVVSDR